MATLYHTATEYTANQLTLLRGTVSDIVSVGVYHNIDPNTVPLVSDFTTVTLVDGTTTPLPPLAESGIIDVVSLVGPRSGQVNLTAAGTYQRWVLVKTAAEDIIRAVDTVIIK